MDTFFDGIKFLLALQLILVAFLYFCSKRNEVNHYLGLLCLFSGLWFLTENFRDYWQSNVLLFFLLGPGKEVFFPSLILLYLKSTTSNLKRSSLLKGLLFPTSYLLVLFCLRFIFRIELYEANFGIVIFLHFVVLTYFSYYFVATRSELDKNVAKRVIQKAFKKKVILFNTFYLFLFLIPVWRIVKTVSNFDTFYIFTEKVKNVVNTIGDFHPLIFLYFSFLGYFLFLFALSELPLFRRVFLPKSIFVSKDFDLKQNKISEILNTNMKQVKAFTDPGINLEKFLAGLEISKGDLIEHLRINKKSTFKDYVNQLRVNEFKTLVKDSKYNNYDLVGLAHLCGFNSKSTFFRVFKDIEGMTPNQFKRHLEG